MSEPATTGHSDNVAPLGSALAIRAEQESFTRRQIEALKKMNGWDEVPAAELSVFFHQAQRTGLDPFARQIYLIGRRNNRRGGRMDYTIQTSIDGMRLVADRTGRYAGSDRPVFGEDHEDKYAEVTVYKIVGNPGSGARVPFTGVAYEAEFRQDSSPMWRKMPRTMLAKCAEAQALRKAFPADLSGIYGSEEMDQAGRPVNTPEDLAAEEGELVRELDPGASEAVEEAEELPARPGDDHAACLEDIGHLLDQLPDAAGVDSAATLEYAGRSYEHAVATERKLRRLLEELRATDPAAHPDENRSATEQAADKGDLPATRKQLNYLEGLVNDVVEDGVARFEEMMQKPMSELTRAEASEWIGRFSGRQA